MKKTRRTSRVGEMVRDALVEVLRHDLKNVDIGFASITGVDVSPDLHFARVYISGLNEEQTRDAVEQLQHARGAARRFLGQRIRLRYTPELDFKFDDTAMRASRIESILQDVAEPEPEPEPEDEDES
ncbi:MAG TPA: 30S ribosome-binding factor RbfA [Thermoanaerobaculia bacterium]|jgi:ribosome-binding factor A|nr:30S ribosome-binding factor RbfA [Thermoanaerobaculia bacterium]